MKEIKRKYKAVLQLKENGKVTWTANLTEDGLDEDDTQDILNEIDETVGNILQARNDEE